MNIDKLIEINQNLDLLPFSVLDGVTDFSTFESSSMKNTLDSERSKPRPGKRSS